MSSWVKIRKGIIVKYSDGPHDLSTKEGWREIQFPAKQWKLDSLGRIVKKSRTDLNADAKPRIRGEAERRQRMTAKIDAAINEAVRGNPVPLRDILIDRLR